MQILNFQNVYCYINYTATLIQESRIDEVNGGFFSSNLVVFFP